MKKLVLLAGILVFATACNQLKDNEFLIKGKIDGVVDGKKVYVKYLQKQALLLKILELLTKVILNLKVQLKVWNWLLLELRSKNLIYPLF